MNEHIPKKSASARQGRRTLSALAALGVGALTTGFAPASSMPPGVPLATGQNELGIAGTVGLGGPSWLFPGIHPLAPDAQLWYSRGLSPALSAGAEIYVGSSSNVGAGVFARLHLTEMDGFTMSAEARLGYRELAVGLPMSSEIQPGVWLYTNPSLGLRDLPFRLPIGVSFAAQDGMWITAEVGARFGGFDLNPWYQTIAHLAGPVSPYASVGLSSRF